MSGNPVPIKNVVRSEVGILGTIISSSLLEKKPSNGSVGDESPAGMIWVDGRGGGWLLVEVVASSGDSDT